MGKNDNIFQELKRKMSLSYPSFAEEISKTAFEMGNLDTAGTDGKKIYFNPNFLNSLSPDEQLFLVAHEFFHMKFEHAYRLKDESGNMRDPHIWNIATDAIINANLVRDGLKMIEGVVDIPNACKYSAEELYKKLLKENQNQQSNGNTQQNPNSQQNNKQNSQNSQQNGGQGSSQNNQHSNQNSQQGGGNSQQNNKRNNSQNQRGNSQQSNQQSIGQDNSQNSQSNQNNQQNNEQNNNKQNGGQGNNQNSQNKYGSVIDNHDLWKNAFEDNNENAEQNNSNGQKDSNQDEQNKDKNEQNDKQNQSQQQNNQQSDGNSQQNQNNQDNNSNNINEREQFENNRELRREIARQYAEQLRSKGLGLGGQDRKVNHIDSAKEVVTWKQLLRREVDKTETVWSQRRSIAENNYAYRLEEYDVDDEALTEVMLDTSGSISATLLKNFVRQLKPLLKNTKLKVGCFDNRFYGFTEIKNDKDIENFRIVGGGGTDFEDAVKNFTFKKEVNKIVFTDGYDEMRLTDKKYAGIVWIVFERKDFKPAVGKVIQVSSEDLDKLSTNNTRKNNIYSDDEYSF